MVFQLTVVETSSRPFGNTPNNRPMKHLLTLTALLISSLAMGQNDPFWNPDANGDDLIGFTDLASLLSVYNSQIGMDSAITCDFDGTDLEQFTLNLLDGTVILDSVFFELELSGETNEYTLGCPDPIQVPWNYSASGMATNVDPYTSDDEVLIWCSRGFENGGSAYFYFQAFRYGPNEPWQINGSISASINYDAITGNVNTWLVSGISIPSQNDNVIWDTLGIRSGTIDPNNFIRVLPYWHYAE